MSRLTAFGSGLLLGAGLGIIIPEFVLINPLRNLFVPNASIPEA